MISLSMACPVQLFNVLNSKGIFSFSLQHMLNTEPLQLWYDHNGLLQTSENAGDRQAITSSAPRWPERIAPSM